MFNKSSFFKLSSEYEDVNFDNISDSLQEYLANLEDVN